MPGVQLNPQDPLVRLADGNVRFNQDGSATVKLQGRNYTVRGQDANGQDLRFDTTGKGQEIANILLQILENKGVLGNYATIDSEGVCTNGKKFSHTETLEGRQETIWAYQQLKELVTPASAPVPYSPPIAPVPQQVPVVPQQVVYAPQPAPFVPYYVPPQQHIPPPPPLPRPRIGPPPTPNRAPEMVRLRREIRNLQQQLLQQQEAQNQQINDREGEIARQRGFLEGMGQQNDFLRQQIAQLQENNVRTNDELHQEIDRRRADLDQMIQNLREAQAPVAPPQAPIELPNAAIVPPQAAAVPVEVELLRAQILQLEERLNQQVQAQNQEIVRAQENAHQRGLLEGMGGQNEILRQQINELHATNAHTNAQLQQAIDQRAADLNRIIEQVRQPEQIAPTNQVQLDTITELLRELREMRQQREVQAPQGLIPNAVVDVQNDAELRDLGQRVTALERAIQDLIAQTQRVNEQAAQLTNNPPAVVVDNTMQERIVQLEQQLQHVQHGEQEGIRALQQEIQLLRTAQNQHQNAQEALDQLKQSYEQQIVQLRGDIEAGQTRETVLNQTVQGMAFQAGADAEERRHLQMDIDKLRYALEKADKHSNTAEIAQLHHMIDQRFNELFRLLSNRANGEESDTIQQLQRKNASLTATRKKLKGDKTRLEESLRNAQEALRNAEGSDDERIVVLTARIKTLEADLAALRDTKRLVDNELADLRARLQGIVAQLDNANAAPGEDPVRQGIAALQTEIRDLNARLQEAQRPVVLQDDGELLELKQRLAGVAAQLQNPDQLPGNDGDRQQIAALQAQIRDLATQLNQPVVAAPKKVEQQVLVQHAARHVLTGLRKYNKTGNGKVKPKKLNLEGLTVVGNKVTVNEKFIDRFARDVMNATQANDNSKAES